MPKHRLEQALAGPDFGRRNATRSRLGVRRLSMFAAGFAGTIALMLIKP